MFEQGGAPGSGGAAVRAWEAGAAAARWVREQAVHLPGLRGAYLSGSLLGAGVDDPWPESSDVDAVLVFAPGKCPPKLGKFRTEGILLEATCLEETEFASLEHVLSTHYLAYALNAGALLYDPDGILAALHRETAARYGDRRWVEARVRSLLERVRQGAEAFDPRASLAAQVNAWAFPTGICCFPILAAALENCTVRRRYSAARRVLERYGMEGFSARLLSLLVPEPLGRERLSAHMDRLEETFWLACGTSGPSVSYPFRSDISPQGAAAAIGGSRELLASERPEEAVFWMLATFARCHIILEWDAPALERERRPAFRALLADLGIRGAEDFSARLGQIKAFLPALEAAARQVMDLREQG